MKPINHKEKITSLLATMQDILVAMCEGNPGGLTVLLQLYQKGAELDPDAMDPILSILGFDTLGIYGSNLWILYKDCCGQRIEGVLACGRSVQLGLITEETLWNWIDNSTPVNVDELITNVQKQLPNFCASLVSQINAAQINQS